MVKDKKINKFITEIVDKIRDEYKPEKIILYGSYAYGEPNQDSDIDLFIIKDTDKRRPERFVEVSKIIHDSRGGIYISPLVYTPREIEERRALADQFVEEVLTRGEVLYAK